MTSISSRSSVDHAATAAEAVCTLIHLTHDRGALGGPAELDRLVAELAVMTGQLPQLLRQLRDWLNTEQRAGQPRPDDTTDPAQIVNGPPTSLLRPAELRRPGQRPRRRTPAPGAPGRHRTRPHPPTRAVRRAAGTASGDGRAETVAISQHFHGPSGQVLWPPAGRNQCPLTLVREHHRVVEMSDPRVWRNPR